MLTMRTLVNRLALLFGSCFESWIKELWPGRHDLFAIDGKTSRRTRDKRKGLKALHTLSACATNARLVLGQRSVPEKTNEIRAIPELLDHLAEVKQLEGALVTIDAMGCQVAIANKNRLNTRLTICSPSRATGPRSKPRSPITSTPLRQKNSSSTTRTLKRGTAASRCEPTPLHPMSMDRLHHELPLPQ
jgi:Transposase DDE domain